MYNRNKWGRYRGYGRRRYDYDYNDYDPYYPFGLYSPDYYSHLYPSIYTPTYPTSLSTLAAIDALTWDIK